MKQDLQGLSNFNSTVVQLEVGYAPRPDLRYLNFNSTVVQLEAAVSPVAVGEISFQFYCSPIRSLSETLENTFNSNFNSTVVQLEVVRGVVVYHDLPFQFYCSPIRSAANRIYHPAPPGFQFYCSPIRSIPDSRPDAVDAHFNSTVVQLEESLCVSPVVR